MKNQLSGSLTFDATTLTAALLAELRPELDRLHAAIAGDVTPGRPLRADEADEILMTVCRCDRESAVQLLDRLDALGVQLFRVPRTQPHASPLTPHRVTSPTPENSFFGRQESGS